MDAMLDRPGSTRAAEEQRDASDESRIGIPEQSGATPPVVADHWGGLFDEVSAFAAKPVLTPDATTTNSVAFPVGAAAAGYTSTAVLDEFEPEEESLADEFEPEEVQEREEVETDEKLPPSTGSAEFKVVAPVLHCDSFIPRACNFLVVDLPTPLQIRAAGRHSGSKALEVEGSALDCISLAQGALPAPHPPRPVPPRPPWLCCPRGPRPRSPRPRRPWRTPPRPPWLCRPRSPRLRGPRRALLRRRPRRFPPRPPWLSQPRCTSSRSRASHSRAVRLRHRPRRAAPARDDGVRVRAHTPRRAEELAERHHVSQKLRQLDDSDPLSVRVRGAYSTVFQKVAFHPPGDAMATASVLSVLEFARDIKGLAVNRSPVTSATPHASTARCSTLGRSHDAYVVIASGKKPSVINCCIDVPDSVPVLACFSDAEGCRVHKAKYAGVRLKGYGDNMTQLYAHLGRGYFFATAFMANIAAARHGSLPWVAAAESAQPTCSTDCSTGVMDVLVSLPTAPPATSSSTAALAIVPATQNQNVPVEFDEMQQRYITILASASWMGIALLGSSATKADDDQKVLVGMSAQNTGLLVFFQYITNCHWPSTAHTYELLNIDFTWEEDRVLPRPPLKIWHDIGCHSVDSNYDPSVLPSSRVPLAWDPGGLEQIIYSWSLFFAHFVWYIAISPGFFIKVSSSQWTCNCAVMCLELPWLFCWNYGLICLLGGMTHITVVLLPQTFMLLREKHGDGFFTVSNEQIDPPVTSFMHTSRCIELQPWPPPAMLHTTNTSELVETISVSTAMDRHDKEKEIASGFMESLCPLHTRTYSRMITASINPGHFVKKLVPWDPRGTGMFPLAWGQAEAQGGGECQVHFILRCGFMLLVPVSLVMEHNTFGLATDTAQEVPSFLKSMLCNSCLTNMSPNKCSLQAWAWRVGHGRVIMLHGHAMAVMPSSLEFLTAQWVLWDTGDAVLLPGFRAASSSCFCWQSHAVGADPSCWLVHCSRLAPPRLHLLPRGSVVAELSFHQERVNCGGGDCSGWRASWSGSSRRKWRCAMSRHGPGDSRAHHREHDHCSGLRASRNLRREECQELPDMWALVLHSWRCTAWREPHKRNRQAQMGRSTKLSINYPLLTCTSLLFIFFPNSFSLLYLWILEPSRYCSEI